MEKFLILTCFLLSALQACASTRPPWVASLRAYANSLGCAVEVDPANHFEVDLDDDGQREVIALFQLDPGCYGGTGTRYSFLAVLEDTAGTGKHYHVRADMSAPGSPMVRFPRWIDRIRLNEQGRFWFVGRDRPGGDPLAEEVPAEGPFTLQNMPVTIPLDESVTFTEYYWKNGPE